MRSGKTSYDGLVNLNTQASPDTGTTTNTYDAAGNLATATDAKGQQTQYTYDALNRITQVKYFTPGPVLSATHTFTYDGGTNQKGRLTGITEPNSTTSYAYDVKGRLLSETRTINAIAYATSYLHDSFGRLTRVTYPGGRQVNYSFDSLGRVQGITTTQSGVTHTVVSAVTYRPLGPVKGYTFGNGQTYARGYDLDGRVTSYTTAHITFSLGYDPASRITSLIDSDPPPWHLTHNSYSYDTLDRLTNYVGTSSNQNFSYDTVGNRLTQTTGAVTKTYSYAASSNRLTGVSGPPYAQTYLHDANGSIYADSVNQYFYDARGRLTQTLNGEFGTVDYKVNALGQRIRKTGPLGDIVYHWDAQGRLLAEGTPAGVIQTEYIYLGDTPVAVVRNAQIYFINTDHLGSARLIRDALGQNIWMWLPTDPFAGQQPIENPSGLGVFTYNLRLPGQYYDRENYRHYNYFRDYDPGIGRYIQPEPLGVRGDINLYRYARTNPLTYYDPDGAQAIPAPGLPPVGVPTPWNPRPQKPSNFFDPPAKPSWSWPSILPSWLIPKSALEKCEENCDRDYDSNRNDCEWRWMMRGRKPEDYRRCMEEVRRQHIKCYQDCKATCG